MHNCGMTGSYKNIYCCESCGKNFINIVVPDPYDYMWITEKPDLSLSMFKFRCQCGGNIYLNNQFEPFGDIILCA